MHSFLLACSMVMVVPRSNRNPSSDTFPLADKTKQDRKTTIFKIQWFPSYIIFKNQIPNNSTVSYPDVCAFKSIMLLGLRITHRIQTNKRTKKTKTPGISNRLDLHYNIFLRKWVSHKGTRGLSKHLLKESKWNIQWLSSQ